MFSFWLITRLSSDVQKTLKHCSIYYSLKGENNLSRNTFVKWTVFQIKYLNNLYIIKILQNNIFGFCALVNRSCRVGLKTVIMGGNGWLIGRPILATMFCNSG